MSDADRDHQTRVLIDQQAGRNLHADKQIENVVDIEFWMHKLFIKVNGYMTKNGFGHIWNASVDER